MESTVALPTQVIRQSPGKGNTVYDFRLYYDEGLSQPTPYHAENSYLAKAKARIDSTFNLLKENIPGSRILDIGASPFYLLDKAKALGASECHAIYFANDSHPLKGMDKIYSKFGAIELSHTNIETEKFPFADNSLDIVTACEILEHCEYFPLHFASEVRRILRPGGLLLITVPNVCSVGNITRLMRQKNIYMKYRSDSTGRHKHEYTLPQLEALVDFLGFERVTSGFMAYTTSTKEWLRPTYRAIAATPGLKRYSPVCYIVGRQPNQKSAGQLGPLPSMLYDDVQSIEL